MIRFWCIESGKLKASKIGVYRIKQSEFVAKYATSSAQIEGTKATIVDAIGMEADVAAWINFFLDGVIETANDSIVEAKK